MSELENPQPAFTVRLNGSGGTLRGWVVVDSLYDGLAMGGVRMTTGVTEEEVAGLARDMTHKFILAGLPIGGAKGGIVADGTDREETFRTFGRTVKPLLHGGIHLGIDMGVTPADRAVFFEQAGYDPRYRLGAPDMPIDWRTYYEPLIDCTGHGVGVAAVTALEASGRTGPARVVVQGFGAVGRAVARFLEDRGHVIVGVADVEGTISADRLPVAELLSVTDEFGLIDRSRLPQGVTVSAEPDAWLDVDADLLVLAAQKHALNDGNAHRLRAALVVEGANLASSAEAREKTRASGATLVPGVIANIGGAGSAALAVTRVVPFGLPADARKAWVFDWIGDRVRRNTRDLLEIAAATAGDPLPELLKTRREERG
ncbi:Glu/Leu/Phe/Val dehydrogenase dimerization domain-containing protein [Streptomyces incarnatus]|uniref:Glu/Leu/Phe/Val dehydrogenase dimerization domain-containing protein n=1 Tax=unclassified Streptomyces TaxID=2593676 RepID=UPI0011A1C4BE|nr:MULTISPECIES: Glu/Leu/Phe/Val dehydrogenase dimerization domain-containing protein [Streptomyces]QHC29821.1 Glu/Leu/Phe/Val dehydrogenase [Streptomyces sp. HF10]WKE71322.1 Glu/Leu/Phe/Val dehydrogenase dimerization domain-containing protein [Streptomyces sp. WP-1]